MTKKFLAALVVVLVGIFVLISLSPSGAANATEKPYFKKYDTTQTWYAPTPATVASPFAVPQTTTVLECGGIKQVDKYTIDTAELEIKYKALIAGGVLNSPADDAPFHPRGVVTALPDCPPVVVVPEKPEKIVEESTVTGEPNCDALNYIVTTTVKTTDYVYNKETNSWDKSEPVEETATQTYPTTDIQCPPVVTPPVVVPPVVEPPVVTPPVVETPVVPVVETVVDKPVKIEAVETAKVLTAEPVAESLAYTGTNENLKLAWAIGAALAGLGLILVLVARLRRGPAKTGTVER